MSSIIFVIAKESYLGNPIQDGKSQMITFNQDIFVGGSCSAAARPCEGCGFEQLAGRAGAGCSWGFQKQESFN